MRLCESYLIVFQVIHDGMKSMSREEGRTVSVGGAMDMEEKTVRLVMGAPGRDTTAGPKVPYGGLMNVWAHSVLLTRAHIGRDAPCDVAAETVRVVEG